MIPGIHVVTQPGQLEIYARGNIGGNIPGAGATFNVPLFKTNTVAEQEILNPADTSIEQDELSAGTHGARRYAGLWILDVFLFQNGPATLALRERPPDCMTNAVLGIADSTRLVWTRQVRTSVAFRQTWRLCGSECRIVYTNGAVAITQFQITITVRAA
jgi:hypothetical protein